MNNIQSYIANVSYMTSLEEMKFYVDKDYLTDLEMFVCRPDELNFTAPKWAVKDDVVFFFHAKTAIQKVKHLRAQIKKNKEKYKYYLDKFDEILKFAELFYEIYGNKIFGVARVSESPQYEENAENIHWKSHIYAEMSDFQFLKRPIPLEEFDSFLKLASQTSITPVLGDQFDKLKEIVLKDNRDIGFLKNSVAAPIPLRNISEKNWIDIAGKYRRRFFLETQFRKLYVDYLLKILGDQKKFYFECSCYKNGKFVGIPDNYIYISGKYLPVEVKLNNKAFPHLNKQLDKYCNVDTVELDKNKTAKSDKLHFGYCIIIDVYSIGVYDGSIGRIMPICDLDDINSIDDVMSTKHAIKEILERG